MERIFNRQVLVQMGQSDQFASHPFETCFVCFFLIPSRFANIYGTRFKARTAAYEDMTASLDTQSTCLGRSFLISVLVLARPGVRRTPGHYQARCRVMYQYQRGGSSNIYALVLRITSLLATRTYPTSDTPLLFGSK